MLPKAPTEHIRQWHSLAWLLWALSTMAFLLSPYQNTLEQVKAMMILDEARHVDCHSSLMILDAGAIP